MDKIKMEKEKEMLEKVSRDIWNQIIAVSYSNLNTKIENEIVDKLSEARDISIIRCNEIVKQM